MDFLPKGSRNLKRVARGMEDNTVTLTQYDDIPPMTILPSCAQYSVMSLLINQDKTPNYDDQSKYSTKIAKS